MNLQEKYFDVIVIGGGHAGSEAALAAAKMGAKTMLMTQSVERIGAMSCNPAIGGTAKGHLVKEIDALGGQMAKTIDATGIQFRILNRKKGPAIWSSRAQADMDLYRRHTKHALEQTPGLTIKQDTAASFLLNGDQIQGVVGEAFGAFYCGALVLTSGTFLNGLIHIGEHQIAAGRAGEKASTTLAEFLKTLGLRIGRLKTGTTPRLDSKTIAWQELEAQHSDSDIIPFSFSTAEIRQQLLPCHITYTNERTHAVIRENIAHSPLYSGQIVGIGPRYCPSIEDKVYRFPDRLAHQIFLEPQGYDTCEVYPNGISTSLPLRVQEAFVRTIKGLEHAEIVRPGYAIEYDFVDPTELYGSLETKKISRLFFAGQINGTTGYEEAGAQGLMAGINACRKIQGEDPVVLERHQAYIGVLIDDLVSKGTSEPYRMFTSRAEHRLQLREDNADLRLTELGRKIGLVSDCDYELFQRRLAQLFDARQMAEKTRLSEIKVPVEYLAAKNHGATTLATLLKRPEINIFSLMPFLPEMQNFSPSTLRRLEIEIKYAGYIDRENLAMAGRQRLEKTRIPRDFPFQSISGLSREVIEKLRHHQPENLRQAADISGITPAAIHLLQIFLKRGLPEQEASFLN